MGGCFVGKLSAFVLSGIDEAFLSEVYIEKEHAFTTAMLAKQCFLSIEIIQDEIDALCENGFLVFEGDMYSVTEEGKAFLENEGYKTAVATAAQRQIILTEFCKAMQMPAEKVDCLTSMSIGMTNRSFIIEAGNGQYIFRTPGEGTEQLVDRYREYANYIALEGKGIADVVVYHNPTTGIKVTEYIHDCHTANPKKIEDIMLCMKALKAFHNTNITVPHTFSFEEHIYYYEMLCIQQNVTFAKTYAKEKAEAQKLLALLKETEKQTCFCHIDSVPGNFLISGNKNVTLIDWEYAGMCDPIADTAMWCLSAAYEKDECDKLLYFYLERPPTKNEWIRFYSYLSLGGFLWGLWAYYKASFGQTYGNYIARMSACCLQYSALVQQIINDENT